MIIGDAKNINLSTSSFERMITAGSLYADKTRMIENFLSSKSDVHLLARQRRTGKSLNLDMLRCFLTDKEDFRHLFAGLYIESSPIWSKVNSAPVLYFNFKALHTNNYWQDVAMQIYKNLRSVISLDDLDHYQKSQFENMTNNRDAVTHGLQLLTEIVYEVTGKRPYLLIDEYDKLLIANYNTDKYDEIISFETALLSNVLKDNNYLEKALLTGVMRVSHESVFSGLNNVVIFDIFNDNVYTHDYGLMEDEINELHELTGFDIDEVRAWYNGIRIGGHAIYNVYSVMSHIFRGKMDCYWGKSGTMDMIVHMLNDSRKSTLARLLNGERVEVEMNDRVSLRQISHDSGDQAFYSMLVQAGYLALEEAVLSRSATATVTIPNIELMIVWKRFIFDNVFGSVPKLRTLFDNANDLNLLAKDVEHFLHDRLSYHDLAVHKNEDSNRAREQLYHVFLLGILSAYDDVNYKRPLSNRESGDGRYDILVEKPTDNFIFEFKTADSADNLVARAKEALAQIEAKRYGEDISTQKRLVRVGVAFFGKMCKVQCGEAI